MQDCMVSELKALETQSETSDHHHHEQHPGVQSTFLKEVKSLVAVIEDMGNPYLKNIVKISWFLKLEIS